MNAVEKLPGIDTASVEAWLVAHVGGFSPPFAWRLLVGGHSNLTYKVEDGQGRAAVVRRPPLGTLLAGAHDIAREFRIVEALGRAGAPVAPALGICTDKSVTGAPFSVTGFVDGRALDTREQADRLVPVGARAGLSESYVDALARVHAVDPMAVGLGDLAKHSDFAGRQLKAWYRSWTSNAEAANLDDPRAHRLRDLIDERRPPEQPVRIVHGDCGLNNCLVGADGRVLAFVDWEVSTLGQALSDLAMALNRWPTPGDPIPGREEMPSNLPGFLTRVQLSEQYATRTGADLSALPYYVVLNHWRSACIAHGVYARYVRGQRGEAPADVERFRAAVTARLDQAEEAAQVL